VHAVAQVAHLDVSTALEPAALVRKINDELPSDINLLDAVVVPRRFHARHAAVARRYVYQIATRRTAFAKPYVWWVKEPLDVERMHEAAGSFVGLGNFASFSAADHDDAEAASSLVLVERVEVIPEGALVLVAIEGSHFLWKMVRRIVGVLVAVGLGELGVEEAPKLLTQKSDLPARLTAPASGLFLSRVFYQGDRRDVPFTAATAWSFWNDARDRPPSLPNRPA
jgi:tRNA pseudouridine38-40 synthase